VLDGKLLYIAIPMLAGEVPFYPLDPRRLAVTPPRMAWDSRPCPCA
jgi:hypothetical protein